MRPLFDLGIRALSDAAGESYLFLPCHCVYTDEGMMGWQISSQCPQHAAMQARLALEMFDWVEHIDHELGLVNYVGILSLECRTCETTILEVSRAGTVSSFGIDW
jgi:hypothetical protein